MESGDLLSSQEPERKEAKDGLEEHEKCVNGLQAELERQETGYLKRLVGLDIGYGDPDDGHDEDAEWHFNDERQEPETCELWYLEYCRTPK